jgi:Fe-S-cluster containining protein
MKKNEISIEKLKRLYQTVDSLTKQLEKIHAERLNCKKGCSACCVDDITVFEIEAENIRQNHAELLDNAEPHAKGMCAFLDEIGACRIYENRPYVCRTQGLPLRWFDEIEGQFAELRDICPLNDEGVPIENLPEDECWTIGEFEAKLAELQKVFGNGEMKRVRLRDLSAEKKEKPSE